MGKTLNDKSQQKVYEACPHCGHYLSPWERVLLGVDRALTCKNCWYRIVYEVTPQDQKSPKDDQKKTKG